MGITTRCSANAADGRRIVQKYVGVQHVGLHRCRLKACNVIDQLDWLRHAIPQGHKNQSVAPQRSEETAGIE